MSANRIWLACLLAMSPVVTPAETTFDAAKAFGALESVRDICRPMVRVSPISRRRVAQARRSIHSDWRKAPSQSLRSHRMASPIA
jgi:hypothetical protein